jgi:hypothetical protein
MFVSFHLAVGFAPAVWLRFPITSDTIFDYPLYIVLTHYFTGKGLYKSCAAMLAVKVVSPFV